MIRSLPDCCLLLDCCSLYSRSSEGAISIFDDGSRMSSSILDSDVKRICGNSCIVSSFDVARGCRFFRSTNRSSKGMHPVSGVWPCSVLPNVRSLVSSGNKYACRADSRTDWKSVLAAAEVEHAGLSSTAFNVVQKICSLKLNSSWIWLSNRQYVPVAVIVALFMAGEPLG